MRIAESGNDIVEPGKMFGDRRFESTLFHRRRLGKAQDAEPVDARLVLGNNVENQRTVASITKVPMEVVVERMKSLNVPLANCRILILQVLMESLVMRTCGQTEGPAQDSAFHGHSNETCALDLFGREPSNHGNLLWPIQK